MSKHLRGFWIIFHKSSVKRRGFWKVWVAGLLLLTLMSLVVLEKGFVEKGSTSTDRLPLWQNERPATAPGSSTLRTIPSTTVSEEGPAGYDILINSYQRSGSSFAGQLLTSQPGTFYWYEPLWNIHGLNYLLGKYVCPGNGHCGDFGSERIDAIRRRLRAIYSCNFTELDPLVAENMTEIYSGASWEPFVTCRAHNQSTHVCLKKMENVCRASKHRATKIVRLTVDNLEYILENVPNVKVMHLIRDPRAIINSQMTTKWYKMDTVENDHKLIEQIALELCVRMKYDLLKGEVLKEKYPKRFAFAMFEDLIEDLKSNTYLLYSYFGIKHPISTNVTDIPGILQGDHNVNRTKGDYSNWWRFQLNFDKVQVIDHQCKQVLAFLGYRIFTNEADLKNASREAYSFREDLLTQNLGNYDPYDFSSLRQQRKYLKKIDIIYGDKITGQKSLFV